MAPTEPGFAAKFPILSLARMEWRIGWRTAAFRLVCLCALLFGWSMGGTQGRGAALSAYTTAEAAWQYLGFVAIVWMSLVAIRETTARTAILVFSKPQPGERIALAKFLGGFLQVLTFLLALFLGSLCARLISGGGLLGVEAYGMQYARAAGVLFFASSASFALALLFDNALAGALVGLYWIMTMAGKAFLAKFYFPAYSQNLAAFLALGLGLLTLTLLLYRRARRGDARPALWVRYGAPLCFLFAGWWIWSAIRYGYDPHLFLNPAMELMREQDTDIGQRAAGFMLPDQHGRQTGLSDFNGKILVIAIWSPKDPDSVLLLDRLNEIQARLGAQGVQAVAITISEDNGAASAFAQGEHLQFPVVMDWSTTSVPEKSESSPLASAYRANALPRVIVTDRRRRIRGALDDIASYDGKSLDELISDRLTEEPR